MSVRYPGQSVRFSHAASVVVAFHFLLKSASVILLGLKILVAWHLFIIHIVKMNSKSSTTMSDRNMISLLSFPFPATKPNMMIKPKVFSIVFRLTNNYSMPVLRIKGTLTKHNNLSELEILRGHCTQALQLRRSHSDEDMYISN